MLWLRCCVIHSGSFLTQANIATMTDPHFYNFAVAYTLYNALLDLPVYLTLLAVHGATFTGDRSIANRRARLLGIPSTALARPGVYHAPMRRLGTGVKTRRTRPLTKYEVSGRGDSPPPTDDAGDAMAVAMPSPAWEAARRSGAAPSTISPSMSRSLSSASRVAPHNGTSLV